MYGKIMSIPDHLIADYFTLLTDISTDDIKEITISMNNNSVNPLHIKKRLAIEIVSQFHSPDSAKEAESYFTKVVQNKDFTEEIEDIYIPFSKFEGLSNSAILADLSLAPSRAAAKRLINQNAVEINGQKITEDIPHITSINKAVVKIGKRKFVRIINKNE